MPKVPNLHYTENSGPQEEIDFVYRNLMGAHEADCFMLPLGIIFLSENMQNGTFV